MKTTIQKLGIMEFINNGIKKHLISSMSHYTSYQFSIGHRINFNFYSLECDDRNVIASNTLNIVNVIILH